MLPAASGAKAAAKKLSWPCTSARTAASMRAAHLVVLGVICYLVKLTGTTTRRSLPGSVQAVSLESYLRKVLRWFRILQLHAFQFLPHDLRHRQVPEPFVVRRNHIPRRFLRAAFPQHVFVSGNVRVPIFPFLQIGR